MAKSATVTAAQYAGAAVIAAAVISGIFLLFKSNGGTPTAQSNGGNAIAVEGQGNTVTVNSPDPELLQKLEAALETDKMPLHQVAELIAEVKASGPNLPTHAADVLRRAEKELAEKIKSIHVDYIRSGGRVSGAKASGNGKILLAEATVEGHEQLEGQSGLSVIVEEVHYVGDGSATPIYRGKAWYHPLLGHKLKEEGFEGRKLYDIFGSWARNL